MCYIYYERGRILSEEARSSKDQLDLYERRAGKRDQVITAENTLDVKISRTVASLLQAQRGSLCTRQHAFPILRPEAEGEHEARFEVLGFGLAGCTHCYHGNIT